MSESAQDDYKLQQVLMETAFMPWRIRAMEEAAEEKRQREADLRRAHKREILGGEEV